MYLSTCLLLCCTVGIAHIKFSNAGYQGVDGASDNAGYHGTNEASDKLFDALIARIDQLEEKLEARDRLHQAEIDKLRHGCQTDVARQTARINELEAKVQIQDDKMKKLMNTQGDTISNERYQETNMSQTRSMPEEAATFKEETFIDKRNSNNVQRKTSVKTRNRIRRDENQVEVAFYASLLSTIDHLGPNQIIPFEHVVTNIGNSYNPQSGVFIAPVAGTYVVSATLTTDARHQAHYGLFMNLVKVASLYIDGVENYADTASVTAVLHLAKGDIVNIKYVDLDHGLAGGAYCMFSGFLLSQTFTGPSTAIVG